VSWSEVKGCIDSLRYIPSECATRCSEENFEANRDWCLQNCEARSDDVNKPAQCINMLYQYALEQGLDPVILDRVKPFLDKLPSIKSGEILLPDHVNSIVDALKSLAHALEDALSRLMGAPFCFVSYRNAGMLELCITESVAGLIPSFLPAPPFVVKELSAVLVEFFEVPGRNAYMHLNVEPYWGN